MKKALLLLTLLATALRGQVVALPDATIPAAYLGGASQAVATGPLVDGGYAAAPDPAWAGKIVVASRGQVSVLAKAAAVLAAHGAALVLVDDPALPPLPAAGLGTTGGGTVVTTSPLTILVVKQPDGAVLRGRAGVVATVPTAPPPPVLRVTLFLSATSVPAGTAFELSVTSDGSPAPALQWRRDGVDIPGQTGPRLAVASAAAGDAGRYTVVATNAGGSAESPAFNVAVTP